MRVCVRSVLWIFIKLWRRWDTNALIWCKRWNNSNFVIVWPAISWRTSTLSFDLQPVKFRFKRQPTKFISMNLQAIANQTVFWRTIIYIGITNWCLSLRTTNPIMCLANQNKLDQTLRANQIHLFYGSANQNKGSVYEPIGFICLVSCFGQPVWRKRLWANQIHLLSTKELGFCWMVILLIFSHIYIYIFFFLLIKFYLMLFYIRWWLKGCDFEVW